MVVGIATIIAEAVVVVLRRGSLLDPQTVVRCREGHLFTTVWIPGGSLKALRLGWWRFQFCPVGRHWSLVSPADRSALTEEERLAAAQRHDVRVP